MWVSMRTSVPGYNKRDTFFQSLPKLAYDKQIIIIKYVDYKYMLLII